MSVNFSRHWGMPSADTFDCPPIEGFVKKYLLQASISVDLFARNRRWATHTNDINPDTCAEYHLDAAKFIGVLWQRGIKSDVVLFDPPYSINQIVQTYQKFGIEEDGGGTHNGALYARVRDAIPLICHPGTIVLSFGWNSAGMGMKRGFEPVEILLVPHGGAHNDTICMAEKQTAKLQPELPIHPLTPA